MAKQQKLTEVSAGYSRTIATVNAVVGNCANARATIASASEAFGDREAGYVAILVSCGDLTGHNPLQITVKRTVPRLRHQSNLVSDPHGNDRGPARQLSESHDLTAPVVASYERAGGFDLWFVRGRAYLGL